ncbi:MAG: hypothetical protein WC640_00365 [Candidatus Paceibacterota bacterium]|jgi:hypothetical protein
MKKVIIILVILLAIFIIAGQWQTANGVKNSITKAFAKEWYGVADGCGLDNVRDINRQIYGFRATIEYGCGFTEKAGSNRSTIVYVLPLGFVYGIPK